LKKILLISDTHGYIDKKILKYCQLADEVWHAGDVGDIKIIDQIKKLKPLRGVYGNIDNNEIRNELTKDCIFICEKMKVWITHIGGYPSRYKKRVNDLLKTKNIDLLIFGHSHILKIIYDKKNLSSLFLNHTEFFSHQYGMMQGIAIFRRGSKRWFTVFTYSYKISKQFWNNCFIFLSISYQVVKLQYTNIALIIYFF